jgi:hypothetical protein
MVLLRERTTSLREPPLFRAPCAAGVLDLRRDCVPRRETEHAPAHDLVKERGLLEVPDEEHHQRHAAGECRGQCYLHGCG